MRVRVNVCMRVMIRITVTVRVTFRVIVMFTVTRRVKVRVSQLSSLLIIIIHPI